MDFHFIARLCAQFPHQAVKQAQNVEIITLLWYSICEGFHAGLARILHKREGVGDKECTECCAQNNDEFPRLDEHADVPAHGDETAEHAAQCDGEADENTQSA